MAQLEETYAKHDFDSDNEDARNHELMPNDLPSATDDLTRSEDRWFYSYEECYDAVTDPKHDPFQMRNPTPFKTSNDNYSGGELATLPPLSNTPPSFPRNPNPKQNRHGSEIRKTESRQG